MKGATVRDIVAPASLHVEADARIRLTRPPFKWARTEVRSLCCPRRLLALVASAAEKERAAADSIALHWHSVRASRPTRSLRSIQSERASNPAALSTRSMLSPLLSSALSNTQSQSRSHEAVASFLFDLALCTIVHDAGAHSSCRKGLLTNDRSDRLRNKHSSRLIGRFCGTRKRSTQTSRQRNGCGRA